MGELISTKKAMQILGVGSTTIKRWANENVLDSVRTSGGHRRFRRVDVERLLLKRSVAGGNPVSCDEWIHLLMRTGDTAIIRDRIVALQRELGSWLELANFLGAVAEQIGMRWASDECTVVEEHVVTERLHRAITAVSDAFRPRKDAAVAALATLSGEQHALGLSLAELCLKSEGFDVRWIGVDTPVDELVESIREAGFDLVGLSASRWSTDYGYLSSASGQIASACEARGIELILGGAGAWPDVLDYGHRCHSFIGLRNILDEIDLSTEPASFQLASSRDWSNS